MFAPGPGKSGALSCPSAYLLLEEAESFISLTFRGEIKGVGRELPNEMCVGLPGCELLMGKEGSLLCVNVT